MIVTPSTLYRGMYVCISPSPSSPPQPHGRSVWIINRVNQDSPTHGVQLFSSFGEIFLIFFFLDQTVLTTNHILGGKVCVYRKGDMIYWGGMIYLGEVKKTKDKTDRVSE